MGSPGNDQRRAQQVAKTAGVDADLTAHLRTAEEAGPQAAQSRIREIDGLFDKVQQAAEAARAGPVAADHVDRVNTLLAGLRAGEQAEVAAVQRVESSMLGTLTEAAVALAARQQAERAAAAPGPAPARAELAQRHQEQQADLVDLVRDAGDAAQAIVQQMRNRQQDEVQRLAAAVTEPDRRVGTDRLEQAVSQQRQDAAELDQVGRQLLDDVDRELADLRSRHSAPATRAEAADAGERPDADLGASELRRDAGVWRQQDELDEVAGLRVDEDLQRYNRPPNEPAAGQWGRGLRPADRTAAHAASEVLGESLRSVGELPPAPGFHAHHIIPSNIDGLDDIRAAAEEALDEVADHSDRRYGNGLDSAANGVWLPGTAAVANEYGRSLHLTQLHSDQQAYADAITREFTNEAGEVLRGAEFRAKLDEVKAAMISGAFRLGPDEADRRAD